MKNKLTAGLLKEMSKSYNIYMRFIKAERNPCLFTL